VRGAAQTAGNVGPTNSGPNLRPPVVVPKLAAADRFGMTGYPYPLQYTTKLIASALWTDLPGLATTALTRADRLSSSADTNRGGQARLYRTPLNRT
jgi:hypothetical protein